MCEDLILVVGGWILGVASRWIWAMWKEIS